MSESQAVVGPLLTATILSRTAPSYRGRLCDWCGEDLVYDAWPWPFQLVHVSGLHWMICGECEEQLRNESEHCYEAPLIEWMYE